MSTSRRSVMAGNWKMFKTVGEAVHFTEALSEAVSSRLGAAALPEIALCAPFTALAPLKATIDRLHAPFIPAAQNMESRDEGAFTGEISPAMLLDLGVRWVIVGHSERRQYFNETDETVQRKVLAALAHGMTPIVCVGEQLTERESGMTDRVVEQMVRAVVSEIEPSRLSELIFAYEPVWAIGTGKVCDAAEADRVCELIRYFAAEYAPAEGVRVLYGGSVKPDNIEGLMTRPNIDGALVGGASLEVNSFLSLIQAACQTSKPVSGAKP